MIPNLDPSLTVVPPPAQPAAPITINVHAWIDFFSRDRVYGMLVGWALYSMLKAAIHAHIALTGEDYPAKDKALNGCIGSIIMFSAIFVSYMLYLDLTH